MTTSAATINTIANRFCLNRRLRFDTHHDMRPAKSHTGGFSTSLMTNKVPND